MDDNVRRCALPGCNVLIEDIPGRPARRYCTAAHRAAARQARRASAHEAYLAENLPWLREPTDEAPVNPAPSRGTESSGPPRAPGVRAADPPTSEVWAPAPRTRSSRLNDPIPRRRRAVAVLGAAGILAGGYVVTASEPPPPSVAAPVQAEPRVESEDEWAARAQVTLTSLNRQLDMIAQTEEAWNQLPENRRTGAPPAAVQAMQERKQLLERRKATLQSQIDTYRSLSRTKAGLEQTEQHLQAVEEALEEAPAEPEPSPEQASVIAALDEQRDLRLRQREAKREELRSLEDNVASATRTPLPDDGEETTEVSNEVMEVIRTDGSGKPDPDPAPAPDRPEGVVGREEQQQAQERQDHATSAPPDPRGPRDESEERRDEPNPKADGGKEPKEPQTPVAAADVPHPSDERKVESGPLDTVVGGVLNGADQGRVAPPTVTPPTITLPTITLPTIEKPAVTEDESIDGQDQPSADGAGGQDRSSTPDAGPPAASSPNVDAPAEPAAPRTGGDDRADRTDGKRRSAPADVSNVEVALVVMVEWVPDGLGATVAVEAALPQGSVPSLKSPLCSFPLKHVELPAEPTLQGTLLEPSGSGWIERGSSSDSVTTYTRTDESDTTRTLTTSSDGYTASQESADGSSARVFMAVSSSGSTDSES
ncbi:MAG: hypothetical protein ACR2GH_14165 [Pseudonocardia sp.]